MSRVRIEKALVVLISLKYHADFEQFKMVRTRRNQGHRESSQGPPTNNPLPSLELTLILRSLEAINETLKGCQTNEVEVEHPPLGLGNLKGSREFDRGTPIKDITRELQNIKLPEYAGGRASERAEAWLE